MTHSNYDVIVLGIGGMGSAALAELARRGRRVLGIEQFAIGHDQGSSHGRTRIIRTAYFEHPAYVPLVRRAFERWRELEQAHGSTLLTACPCLTLGPEEGELVQGVLRSARDHALRIERLTIEEVRQRFPAFHVEEGYVGVLEHDAGILRVEDCVHAFVERARKLGAECHVNERVISWKSTPSAMEVVTDRASYHADRLIITAGPWAGQLLQREGVPLSLMRQVTMWFRAEPTEQFQLGSFPVFIVDTQGEFFYGFPQIDEHGLKVARHYGGVTCQRPEEIDRAMTDDDDRQVRDFLAKYLPGANGERRDASVCIYTLTPDHHFIIDQHPDEERVVLAAGFSGHGYKFAPMVGEILADLVEHGQTNHPIEMFRIDRFGALADEGRVE